MGKALLQPLESDQFDSYQPTLTQCFPPSQTTSGAKKQPKNKPLWLHQFLRPKLQETKALRAKTGSWLEKPLAQHQVTLEAHFLCLLDPPVLHLLHLQALMLEMWSQWKKLFLWLQGTGPITQQLLPNMQLRKTQQVKSAQITKQKTSGKALSSKALSRSNKVAFASVNKKYATRQSFNIKMAGSNKNLKQC